MRGLHHLHARKRISRGAEPFPSRSLFIRILDRIVLVVGALGPLMSVPQVYHVYATHDASGLVAITWGGLAVLNVPWVLYGLVHREYPIITAYSLWFFINISMCAATLLYGGSLY